MNKHLPYFAAALEYLARDCHLNRELLIALLYELVITLQVALRKGSVVGVLIRTHGPHTLNTQWVQLDAQDANAVDELVQAAPMTEQTILSIHRSWIGALLVERYGITPTGDSIYSYLVNQRQLVHLPQSAACLLTPNDWALVERSQCGWNRSYFEQLFIERRQPWAIIKDGQIVCRASSGYPYAECEEVVGVWTHERWHGRGFARTLVRAVAADILGRAQYATYRTTHDNPASQAVARAVGFQPCFTAHAYQLRAMPRPNF